MSFSRKCQGESQKTLAQELYDLINESKTMEYLWSQKTDDVKHTGIVIKFDYTPKFILDFGGDLNTLEAQIKVGAVVMTGLISPLGKMKRAISRMILSGRVTLSEFSSSDIKIIGRLVELPLSSLAERENAVNLFKSIKHIDAGDYKLMENNCRTYVVTVVRLLSELPEFKSEDYMAFEQEMQKLQSEDQSKFEKCWECAGTFLSQKKKAMSHLSGKKAQKELPPAEEKF